MPSPQTAYTDLYATRLVNKTVTPTFVFDYGNAYFGGFYFGEGQLSVSLVIQTVLAYAEKYLAQNNTYSDLYI